MHRGYRAAAGACASVRTVRSRVHHGYGARETRVDTTWQLHPLVGIADRRHTPVTATLPPGVRHADVPSAPRAGGGSQRAYTPVLAVVSGSDPGSVWGSEIQIVLSSASNVAMKASCVVG